MLSAVPRHYCKQLFALSACYGLITFVALAALVLISTRSKFTFFSALPAGRGVSGSFWVPNWATLFPVCIALFSLAAQGYIWSMIKIDEYKGDQTNSLIWSSMCWLPLWFAGYCLVWNTIFTADMSRLAAYHHASYARTPAFARYLPSARSTNALLLALPVMVIVSTAVPFTFGNIAYNTVYHSWMDFDTVAKDAEDEWDGKIDDSVTDEMAALMQKMKDASAKTVLNVRVGYVAYFVWGLLLCMVSEQGLETRIGMSRSSRCTWLISRDVRRPRPCFCSQLRVLFVVKWRRCKHRLSAKSRATCWPLHPPIESGRLLLLLIWYATFLTKVKTSSLANTEASAFVYSFATLKRIFTLSSSSVVFVSSLYSIVALSIAIFPTSAEHGALSTTKHSTSTRVLIALWAFAGIAALSMAATLYSTIKTSRDKKNATDKEAIGKMGRELVIEYPAPNFGSRASIDSTRKEPYHYVDFGKDVKDYA